MRPPSPLARQAACYTIIRSATHKLSVHERASYLVMSGHEPLATVNHPSMGAVACKELGARNELPPYVSIPAMTGLWESAGMLPGKYSPFEAGDPNKPGFSVRDVRLPMEWIGRAWSAAAAHCSDGGCQVSRIAMRAGVGETVDAFRQTAYDLVRSARAKAAFDLAQEPEKTREMYGRTSIGQACLLARRLVENGVRFVTVSNGYYKWDHHAKVFENLGDRYLPEFDRALATLLEDLDERGLLATTLVIATGEFGRTPEVNVNAGRDHWPNVFSILVAGAGVPGGQVWGSSDADGMYVSDNPVEIPDLVPPFTARWALTSTRNTSRPSGGLSG